MTSSTTSTPTTSMTMKSFFPCPDFTTTSHIYSPPQSHCMRFSETFACTRCAFTLFVLSGPKDGLTLTSLAEAPVFLRIRSRQNLQVSSVLYPRVSVLGPVLFVLLLGLTVKHNRDISYHLGAKDIQLYCSVSLFQVYWVLQIVVLNDLHQTVIKRPLLAAKLR